MGVLHVGDKLYKRIGVSIREFTILAYNKNVTPVELYLNSKEDICLTLPVTEIGKTLFFSFDEASMYGPGPRKKEFYLEVKCGQFLYFANEEGSIKHCVVLCIDKHGFIVQCENNKTYFINFDLVGKKVFVNLADVPKRKRKSQPKPKLKPKKKFKKQSKMRGRYYEGEIFYYRDPVKYLDSDTSCDSTTSGLWKDNLAPRYPIPESKKYPKLPSLSRIHPNDASFRRERKTRRQREEIYNRTAGGYISTSKKKK